MDQITSMLIGLAIGFTFGALVGVACERIRTNLILRVSARQVDELLATANDTLARLRSPKVNR